jgi:cobalt-zinc-cadmium efflux system membrane fusion protein
VAEAGEAGHEHAHVEVSPERQRAWGLEVGEVRRADLAGRIIAPGSLALNGNRTAHVSSFVDGQVASLAADLGDRVRPGQPLLVVNSPEFAAAQADFLEARARYNLGLTESRRAEALWQAKAIEEKEYLRRRAESEKLAAEYGARGSKLHSLGLTHDEIEALIEKCRAVEAEEYKCEVADPLLPILSPLAGTVIFRDAVVGDHVEPGAVLFTVSDLRTLWAQLDVPESDIPALRPESRVSVRSTLFPGREFPAKIGVISDVLDDRLRTLRVRLEVDNAEGLLKPNMYVEGIIEHASPAWTGVLAVPEEAVQTLEDEKIVFVREKDDVFAVRHVRTGDRVGDRRIVLDGLEEGEPVVLKGAFTLKSELTKGAAGHGHVH